jgi:hypothetical protein
MEQYRIQLQKEEAISHHNVKAHEIDDRPLLLVAFHPNGRSPDRGRALAALGVTFGRRGKRLPENAFFNYTGLQHHEWLAAISHHRFTLAPHGHGLDTHRMMEILLMGGIPVIKKSTISSCYDDTDNHVNESTPRGSLPVVVVNSWSEVTQVRLESEWSRITHISPDSWDWKRLLLDYWAARIGCQN